MPGMTKCCHDPVPEIGSQPSVRPSVIIRIRPNQKLGIAWPTMVTIVTARSIQVPSRKAASVPSGIETMSARPRPTRPSVMVIGMRWRIRLDTRSLKKKLSPRSPTMARPIQFTNWTTTGRSRP